MDRCPICLTVGQLKGRATGENEDDVFVDTAYGGNQRLLAVAQLHMKPIHTFGFQNFLQAYAKQNDLRLLGDGDGFADQGVIGNSRFAVIALGIADDLHTGIYRAVVEIVQLGGIDLRGACALITGRLGKITDDGNGLVRRKGQDPIVIQQYDALLSALAGDLMVGFVIYSLIGIFYIFGKGKDHIQQLRQSGVQHAFRDAATANGGDKTDGAVCAGEGHHQVRACPNTFGMVVVCAPVGDHKALKAPFLAENIGK